jgi:methyl-accepting chemotaxis protein
VLKYTDEEIARQLEELGNTITTGINSAQDVLQQAQQIENTVLTTQRHVDQKASQIEVTQSEIGEIADKIKIMRSQIEQMVQQVQFAVDEVGGKQGLQALRQKYQAETSLLRQTQQRHFFWLLAITIGVAVQIGITLFNQH